MFAQVTITAAQAGVFHELAKGRRSAADLLAACELHENAGRKLLSALSAIGHVNARDGLLGLTDSAKKWLVPGGTETFHDRLLFQSLEWKWWSKCGDYVRTGQPLDIHGSMAESDWRLYQLGMQSGKKWTAEEVAAHIMMDSPERMLDIGGSHGAYSAALCRRYQTLLATILDLPEAVQNGASSAIAQAAEGQRIEYQAGNVLKTTLPECHYDLCFVGSLIHHFSENENRRLMAQIYSALRPGGICAVLEMPRIETEEPSLLGGLLDLYFAMTSNAGSYSIDEVEEWFEEAGLVPEPTQWLGSAPHLALQMARKPAI